MVSEKSESRLLSNPTAKYILLSDLKQFCSDMGKLSLQSSLQEPLSHSIQAVVYTSNLQTVDWFIVLVSPNFQLHRAF